MSLFTGILDLVGVQKQFHELSLRHRVAVGQLPLVVCVGIAAVIAAYVQPTIFLEPAFLGGLVLVATLTAACLVVPWDRLAPNAYWAIPLLDFVAIGAIRLRGDEAVAGLSLLAMMPVFWLAWSGAAPTAARGISFVAPLLIVWFPVFLGNEPVTGERLAVPLLVPLVTFAAAVSASVVSQSMSRQQRDLQAKDHQLQQTLAESRHRSRQLSTVLNTVGVGVVVVDDQGRDLLMNDRQRSYHRLAIPETVPDPDESRLLLFGPDRTTPIPAQQRPVRRGVAGESFSNQLLWLGPGSGQRALSASANAMKHDDGTFAGSVIAFNDVTDLVEALAAKDDFVHGVSHEFRTPLTSIIGYLDLAVEEVEETDPEGSLIVPLRVALRNAERLLRLVSDLLASASGTVSVTVADACLADVVRSSLASAAPQAEMSGVELVNESPDTLPARIDPDRIGQVLDNLLSNAVKYSPGGGTVTVLARSVHGAAVVEVRDTGMGMSESDQAQVFTRFFRSGAVRSAAITGAGLGLVVSKSIVQAHGGTINFRSTLGAGTTFTVVLPSPAGTGATM